MESSGTKQDQPSLWVVEGVFDFPAALESDFYVAPLGALDRFVQFRPVDFERSRNRAFWAPDKPFETKARALILANDIGQAMIAGSNYFEALADRLAMVSGQFVQLTLTHFAYNEEELRQCIAGNRHDYATTIGGVEAFRVQPLRNVTVASAFLAAPIACSVAMHWFRKGMTSRVGEERFLSFYIALESIAEQLPHIEPKIHKCRKCGFNYATSKTHAAIDALIANRPGNPPNTGQLLAKIRSQLFHGTPSAETIALAAANSAFVQRLAADGIARVLGINPDEIQFAVSPFQVNDPKSSMFALGRAEFDPANNAAQQWGSILSEEFSRLSATP